MTCIIALEHNGIVFLGADSRITGGDANYSELHPNSPKIFRLGKDYIAACSGHVRLKDIIQTFCEIPPNTEQLPLRSHLIKNWVDDYRLNLKIKGIMEITNNLENTKGGVIVASGHEVCLIGNQFHIECPPELGYLVMGSGYKGAECVIYNMLTHNRGMKPETMITQAIEAVAAHDTSVGGRVDIMHT